MIPCRHLDYDESKYGPDCVVRSAAPHFPTVRYWVRGTMWTSGPGEPGPSKVQFCKLRGRINGVFQCYRQGEMPCYEPVEEPRDE